MTGSERGAGKELEVRDGVRNTGESQGWGGQVEGIETPRKGADEGGGLESQKSEHRLKREKGWGKEGHMRGAGRRKPAAGAKSWEKVLDGARV